MRPRPTPRPLHALQRDEMDAWMRPVWSDIRGASLRAGHPAPFPPELAERLIRMFSFAGDLILDPFAGSGSTAMAAIRAGRNSISIEIEQEYLNSATRRAAQLAAGRLIENHTAIVVESIGPGCERAGGEI
jgi:DNA modification methylase